VGTGAQTAIAAAAQVAVQHRTAPLAPKARSKTVSGAASLDFVDCATAADAAGPKFRKIYDQSHYALAGGLLDVMCMSVAGTLSQGGTGN
jgi:hypothetical protein